ncbi:hypothetical protein AVEN_45633-1 [Araneus ventricosus]|uniref:Uncharacterized protein n=1 Tax=Araneus ventricosus TaxID=182803 RepID=A0A4Y2ER37_ARAVE|nr:hypothetical protein AVEN_45633-1 [Araneus ventricosus]
MRDEVCGDTLLPRPRCEWRDSVHSAEADVPRQLFAVQPRIGFSRAEKEKMGRCELVDLARPAECPVCTPLVITEEQWRHSKSHLNRKKDKKKARDTFQPITHWMRMLLIDL